MGSETAHIEDTGRAQTGTTMTTNLFDNWNSRDDKKMAPKPLSVRLPVHVVARLHALYELHPDKIKNDMLIDLIKAGLDSFEQGLPQHTLEEIDAEQNGVWGRYEIPVGYRADYYHASNKHYQKLQEELGNKKFAELFDVTAREIK